MPRISGPAKALFPFSTSLGTVSPLPLRVLAHSIAGITFLSRGETNEITRVSGSDVMFDFMNQTVRPNKKEYMILEKPTFGSVELPEYIKENYNPEDIEIELIGLCTDICVVSNALILKANFYQIGDIKVVANACAGVTPESHEAALTTMRMCQIDVVETL